MSSLIYIDYCCMKITFYWKLTLDSVDYSRLCRPLACLHQGCVVMRIGQNVWFAEMLLFCLFLWARITWLGSFYFRSVSLSVHPSTNFKLACIFWPVHGTVFKFGLHIPIHALSDIDLDSVTLHDPVGGIVFHKGILFSDGFKFRTNLMFHLELCKCTFQCCMKTFTLTNVSHNYISVTGCHSASRHPYRSGPVTSILEVTGRNHHGYDERY